MLTRVGILALFFVFSQMAFAHHTGSHSGSSGSPVFGSENNRQDDFLSDKDLRSPLQIKHATAFISQRKGAELSENQVSLKLGVEIQTGIFSYEKIGEDTIKLYESGESYLKLVFDEHGHTVIFKIQGRKLDFQSEDESSPSPALWALQVVRVDYDNGKAYAKSDKVNFLVEEKQTVEETFSGMYQSQFRNFRISFSI